MARSAGVCRIELVSPRPPAHQIVPAQALRRDRPVVEKAELAVLHDPQVVVDGIAQDDLGLRPVRREDQVFGRLGDARAGGPDAQHGESGDALRLVQREAVLDQVLVDRGGPCPLLVALANGGMDDELQQVRECLVGKFRDPKALEEVLGVQSSFMIMCCQISPAKVSCLWSFEAIWSTGQSFPRKTPIPSFPSSGPISTSSSSRFVRVISEMRLLPSARAKRRASLSLNAWSL